MVALLLRPVVDEQLGRSKRVGNHDGDTQRHGAQRQLGDDGAVRRCREFEAAIPFRNDHAEEAMLLQIGPDLVGKISILMELPIRRHATDLFDWTVEKSRFFRAELRVRLAVQSRHIRLAREQLPLDPDGASFDHDLFGFGHMRKQTCPLQQIHDGRRDERAAQGGRVQHDRHDGEGHQSPCRSTQRPQPCRRHDRPQPHGRATEPESAQKNDGSHGDQPAVSHRQ